MVSFPSPVPPEQLREAIRDLIGILRGYYAAESEGSSRRSSIARAGQLLLEVSAMLESVDVEPDSDEYTRAMRAADGAVNDVLGSMHFNASLAPVNEPRCRARAALAKAQVAASI